jgi:exopolysaccharide biosynthesis polyprenyl glycosylphosphotransferase
MGKTAVAIMNDDIYRLSHMRPFQLAGIPMVAMYNTTRYEWQELLKKIFDIILATLGLILTAPLMLGIALAIRLTSPGPILFVQKRVGLNGRTFNMYKFRTMVPNAEELKTSLSHLNEMSGPVFKIKDDPRVTPIGRFLRKTSLDELPQLWNVLRQDMSLVGPRPPLPSEVNLYNPSHRKRLSVKPGITCIWQISGRNDIDFDKWMEMDAEYVDNWSLGLDLKILAKTLPVVIGKKGAS